MLLGDLSVNPTSQNYILRDLLLLFLGGFFKHLLTPDTGDFIFYQLPQFRNTVIIIRESIG